MAVEVNLAAQPQKGRVLAAWGLIGWRWIWRSPAAAIVPLLEPFFFLYVRHLSSSPAYFQIQVAGAIGAEDDPLGIGGVYGLAVCAVAQRQPSLGPWRRRS